MYQKLLDQVGSLEREMLVETQKRLELEERTAELIDTQVKLAYNTDYHTRDIVYSIVLHIV